MMWKKNIEDALKGGMRFCFPQVDMVGKTTYPTLSEDEFYGEVDPNTGDRPGGGFLHFIQSILFNARKEAFMQGYAKGVIDCAADAKLEVDTSASRFGADKAFTEFDRDSSVTNS